MCVYPSSKYLIRFCVRFHKFTGSPACWSLVSRYKVHPPGSSRVAGGGPAKVGRCFLLVISSWKLQLLVLLEKFFRPPLACMLVRLLMYARAENDCTNQGHMLALCPWEYVSIQGSTGASTNMGNDDQSRWSRVIRLPCNPPNLILRVLLDDGGSSREFLCLAASSLSSLESG